MYWNSKLFCKCILLSNPCFKKKEKRKKNHIIHADIWVSWWGQAGGEIIPDFGF